MSRNDIRLAVINGRTKAVREIYDHVSSGFPYMGMTFTDYGKYGMRIQARNWTLYIYKTRHMERITADSSHGDWLFVHDSTLTKGFGLEDLKLIMKDHIWW